MENELKRLDERCDYLTKALQEGYVLLAHKVGTLGMGWEVLLEPQLPEIPKRRFYFFRTKRDELNQRILKATNERERIEREMPVYGYIRADTLNQCFGELADNYRNKNPGKINAGTYFKYPGGGMRGGYPRSGGIGVLADIIAWEGLIGVLEDSQIHLEIPIRGCMIVPEAKGLSSRARTFNDAFYELSLKAQELIGNKLIETARCVTV